MRSAWAIISACRDRNGVRTPMQWDSSPNAGFTSGTPYTSLVKGELAFRNVNVATQVRDAHSLFHTVQRMIAVRKVHIAFGGSSMEWVEIGNPTVAAYLRRNGDDVVLILNNLSRDVQSVVVPPQYRKDYLELLRSSAVSLGAELELAPYSFLWLQPPKGDERPVPRRRGRGRQGGSP